MRRLNKPFWQSITFWVNAAIVAFALYFGLKEAASIALINIALRFKTRSAIICLLLIITGCAGADIVIRDDKNKSPLDGNYLTLAFETVCEGQRLVSFGQAGCSVSFDSDLSQSFVTIASPLRSSVSVKSKTTGYNKTFFVDAGETITWSLSELIPLQTEHATFSFVTKWEKPDSVKTEIAVRGQEGRFYFRLRPKDALPAKLTWSPSGSATKKALPGMAFSQFSADGSISDEPILLKINTTKSVGLGKYQLYSEAKQIGIKNTEFSGDEILVPKSKLIGPGKIDYYSMAGWAVSNELSLFELDNDFVVGVNLYDSHIRKLSAKISFTESKVCYKTENVVSLVALSDVEKASNDIEDCFERPQGIAYMFFFTSVGRSAFAEINGESGEYIFYQ